VLKRRLGRTNFEASVVKLMKNRLAKARSL
jgi:hypothetical protein